MILRDVVFLSPRDSLSTTALMIVVEVKTVTCLDIVPGAKQGHAVTCLYIVPGAKQGHAACKILSLRQFLFGCSIFLGEFCHCHKIKVNLATVVFRGDVGKFQMTVSMGILYTLRQMLIY